MRERKCVFKAKSWFPFSKKKKKVIVGYKLDNLFLFVMNKFVIQGWWPLSQALLSSMWGQWDLEPKPPALGFVGLSQQRCQPPCKLESRQMGGKHERLCMKRSLGALFSVMNTSNYLIGRRESIMNVGGPRRIETRSKHCQVGKDANECN